MPWFSKLPDLKNNPLYLEPRVSATESQLAQIAKKTGNVVVVSKTNGDYTTITEAVNYAKNLVGGATIYIYPATYEESVYIAPWWNINLIGIDKKRCIVKTTTGLYADAPLETAGDRYISNLTFLATRENQGANPDSSMKAYAFHLDYSGGTGTLEVFNCDFISHQGPALGSGLHQDEKVLFRSCNFISKTPNALPSFGIGAMFIHSAVASGVTGQKAIFDRCHFEFDNGTTGGYAVYINDANWTDGDKIGNEMAISFRNCTMYVRGKGSVDVVKIDNTGDATQKLSGRIALGDDSTGNNTSVLNKEYVQFKYPTLLNGLTNFNTGSYPELRYYKDGSGNVILEGMIKGGTGNIDVGYLEAGYRPKRTTPPAVINTNDAGTGDGVAFLSIYADGRIRVIGMKSGFTAINTVFFAEQ